jgi:serpin B
VGRAAPANVDLVAADTARAALAPAGVGQAARSVQGFGADLYGALRSTPGNLLVSPYSVAVALAMTREGARGTTAAAFDRVLHTGDPATAGSAYNSLQLELQRRAGSVRRGDGSTAEIAFTVADAVWGQRGVRWQKPFLEALATHFGTGVREVDFTTNPQAVRAAVNGWAERETKGLIRDLLPPDAVDEDTRLVLANAVHLKAPWEAPFDKEATATGPFTRGDGRRVDAAFMTHQEVGHLESARGAGWTAVRLRYAGGQLALAVVVPDAGRLEAVERAVEGAWLARLLSAFRPANVRLKLPRWSFRFSAGLAPALSTLGLGVAFGPGADFSGMTTDARLLISSVVHQAVMTVDEQGTEAAAATAVVARIVSAPMVDLELTVDRPFLVVLHDVATGTPLFLGRVDDPTAG